MHRRSPVKRLSVPRSARVDDMRHSAASRTSPPGTLTGSAEEREKGGCRGSSERVPAMTGIMAIKRHA
jgi:hypothetical protein